MICVHHTATISIPLETILPSGPSEMTSVYEVPALKRIHDILDVLACSQQAMRATELAEATGLSRSTLYLTLDSLERRRWIARQPDGYVIGLTLFEFGNAYVRHDRLQDVSGVKQLPLWRLTTKSCNWRFWMVFRWCTLHAKTPQGRYVSFRISGYDYRRIAARLAKRFSPASPTMRYARCCRSGWNPLRKEALRNATFCLRNLRKSGASVSHANVKRSAPGSRASPPSWERRTSASALH